MSDAPEAGKPRVRVAAPGVRTADSYANLASRLGMNAPNLAAAGRYTPRHVTRDRTQLETAYRGSWVVRAAVNLIAEDMTRAGIDYTGPFEPGVVAGLQQAKRRLRFWPAVTDAVRWARLYGGGLAVMMIDGQDPSTPLRPQTVGRGAFRGLLALDRWQVNTTTSETIRTLGPDLGLPEFYEVGAGMAYGFQRVHHTRVLRFDGDPLPFNQRFAEGGWGMSVVEPLWDRLLAFESATTGAAQMVHRAHLRTMRVKGYRELAAMGTGPAWDGFIAEMNMIRLFQSIEGLTVLDGEDEFETHTYSFAGLADMIQQFAQQIGGAIQTPLTRLLGQSPGGLGSNGNAELIAYYDGVHQRQEGKLRAQLTPALDALVRSETGRPPPEGWGYTFNPLWGMTEAEKADVAGKITAAVVSAAGTGIIKQSTALKELRQSSDVTGIYTNIGEGEIQEAEDAEAEPPAPGELDTGDLPDPSEPTPDEPPPSGVGETAFRPTKRLASVENDAGGAESGAVAAGGRLRRAASALIGRRTAA